jgi:hypothetical protein
MKKTLAIVMALVLVLGLGAVASAQIFGGVEDRIELSKENQGAHQALGDPNGNFTAKLNGTQLLYKELGITDMHSLEQAGGPVVNNAKVTNAK